MAASCDWPVSTGTAEVSPIHSRHTSEGVVVSVSPKKSNGPSPKINGDFIRARSVSDSAEFPSTADRWTRLRRFAKRWTSNAYVNQFMALVVLFDAYCNCSDIDARAQGETVNPTLAMAAGFCLLLYSVELGLIIFGQGWVALKDWVFLLDMGVIACGFTEMILDLFIPEGELANRIGILRLLRLGRVIRLLQLLRKTRALRELQKLVTMMSTCLKALAWSFIFCFVVMTIWAMLMVEVINPLIKDLHISDPSIFQDCPQCLRATSSVMDANLLLFKTVIAGDSWGTIAVPVIEAYPATAVIFVGSLLTLVFGVLNLIVAVVVDTFADARDRDILNLAEEMEQDMEADKRFLEAVFHRIDVDNTGQLTLDQLVEGARSDTEFQSRLKVMDIDEMDLVQLFEMIDTDNSGAIEPNEFIRPLSRWVRDSKTAPRFIKYNMMRVMHKQDELQSDQADLRRSFESYFGDMSQRIAQLHSELRPLSPALSGATQPLESVGPWQSKEDEAEYVEQPHSSEKVTLKRLSETQANVDDAMNRLNSLVLRATEMALKESTGMVKHLLLDVTSPLEDAWQCHIAVPRHVELPAWPAEPPPRHNEAGEDKTKSAEEGKLELEDRDSTSPKTKMPSDGANLPPPELMFRGVSTETTRTG